MNDLQNAAWHYLRREPLKHILHLKMLTHHGRQIETFHVVEGSTEGSLLLFPTTALSYDQGHYGDYELVAMPVADSPRLMARLLNHVPQTGVVFKLIEEIDEALVAARFKGERVRAFLNFTSSVSADFNPDLDVVISTRLNDGLLEAFGKNGHTPAELGRFFADGGRAFAIEKRGQPVSVGMVYRDFEHIWEIAALYTRPSARRKGYSARIVRAALCALNQAGYTPRIVVDDTNIPSIKLAQAVELERFLTVVHFSSSGKY